MYWYILFVRTGREHKIEQILKNLSDADLFTPFVPLHEKLYKIAGVMKKELKPLFPGYVFIESELPSQEFLRKICLLVNSILDIFCILRYSNVEVSMREHEMRTLLSLCNNNGFIETSSGIIVGDRINITDGPLKGWESLVKKVNRHKRQAWIELEFMGEKRLVSVALEIVEKINEPSPSESMNKLN